MLFLDEAWDLVAASVRALAHERVALEQAFGRILAEPAAATVDLPPFDRSAMDGFAVRAEDTGGARLRVIGAIAPGGLPGIPVEPGTAVEVATGAPLPPGADAVLQRELVLADGDGIVPAGPTAAGRFVRFQGEDVRAGEVLGVPGAIVSVQRLAKLASAGVGEVVVHRRAEVQIVVNGGELQEPGTALQPGAIFESNGVVLRHLVRRSGAALTGFAHVGDDAADVRWAVERGLSGDVLIVSGGMSGGRHDHFKAAFQACEVEQLLRRVRIKPGRPFWFGRRSNTLVFGLPGNPLSSLVCFLLFIEPALRRMHGERGARSRRLPARLTVSVVPEEGRTTLLTARFDRAADGMLLATPTFRQGSHMNGALGESDCFVIVPHDSPPMPAGAEVDLLLPDGCGAWAP
jgi:molybdopterin molybdotransferase